MAKVYQIAQSAGMDPNNFCKIRNGCFEDETIVKVPETGLGSPSNPFRGILASTKISQLLGVEPVAAAEEVLLRPKVTNDQYPDSKGRAWWYEVGDYLENPHRHFQVMEKLRLQMEWPEDIRTK